MTTQDVSEIAPQGRRASTLTRMKRRIFKFVHRFTGCPRWQRRYGPAWHYCTGCFTLEVPSEVERRFQDYASQTKR